MNALTRWDPFREMWNLRRTMDRLFDTAFTDQLFGEFEPTRWGLALDVAEDEDEYIVKASIPGINPDDLEITLTDNTLTIKGEVKSEEETKKTHSHPRPQADQRQSQRQVLIPPRLNFPPNPYDFPKG